MSILSVYIIRLQLLHLSLITQSVGIVTAEVLQTLQACLKVNASTAVNYPDGVNTLNIDINIHCWLH